MKRRYSEEPLRAVITPIERAEQPVPGKSYRQLGVRLWGEGAYEREPLDGGNTRYSALYQVRRDEVVVNKIWARNGSVALVPPSLDGCYVSGEFPTFIIDHTRLIPRWFHWLTKTSGFWQQCDQKSQGTSGKNRIRPEQFLSVTIPLPPLDEQRRIVTRIEELAGKIEEARGLRREVETSLGTLVSSVHLGLSSREAVPLKDFLVLDERKVDVNPDGIYPQVGVKGLGQGLFAKESIRGIETTYRSFNQLYSGAVVLSQVKGWEGAIAVCPAELAGKYVSPEYRTFRCVDGAALPEYLAGLVAAPWFWRHLQGMSRGIGARRERTRPEQFLELRIPMPPIEGQRTAIALFERAAELRRIQSAVAPELDALLPSILDRAFKGEL